MMMHCVMQRFMYLTLLNIMMTLARGLIIVWPWIFMGGLPPLHFGVWMNVEGVAFYCAVLSSIASFILCLWSLFDPHRIVIRLSSLLWGGMLGLGLVFWPLSLLKELSWFGHPEGCLGLWFFMSCFSFSLLLHSILQKDPGFARIATISLVSSVVVLLALTVVCHGYYWGLLQGEWVIYHFTSYLIWPAVGLFLIHHIPLLPWKRWAIVIVGVLCILLSQSKVAYLLLIGSPLFLLGFWQRFLHYPFYRNPLILLCVSIPFGIAGVSVGAYYFNIFQSLISRFTSLEVIIQHFLHQPLWRILTGFGFGYTTDAIILMRPFLNQAAQGGWEGFGRFDASCLHQFLDMIHGIGLLGGALFLCFMMLPIFSLKQQTIYLTGKTANHVMQDSPYIPSKKIFFPTVFAVILNLTVSSLWFVMLSTFFMMFLGYLLHEKDEPTFSFSHVFVRWSSLFFLCMSVALVMTSFSFYRTGLFFSGDFQKTSLPVALGWKKQPLSPKTMITNGGPNLLHLSFLLKRYAMVYEPSMDVMVKDLFEKTIPMDHTVALTHSFDLFLKSRQSR